MAKYVVMTNGRYKNSNQDVLDFDDDERSTYPRDSESLTMDVHSPNYRRPISLIQAKQRAAEIVNSERGVSAYICKVEFVVEEQRTPVVIRKLS